MRLIDADALKKHFTENPSDIDICHIKDLLNLINNAPAIEQNVKCSSHPDAPHGFCRDASHTANRYVCECEGWTLASTPAIEQCEPVAYVSKETAYYFGISQKCESGVFRYGKFDDATIPLYTAPPQPQPVKDALEKAAKIVQAKIGHYYPTPLTDAVNEIRALKGSS